VNFPWNFGVGFRTTLSEKLGNGKFPYPAKIRMRLLLKIHLQGRDSEMKGIWNTRELVSQRLNLEEERSRYTESHALEIIRHQPGRGATRILPQQERL
jgi:hypothetical protein